MEFNNPNAFWLLLLVPIYFTYLKKRTTNKNIIPLPTFYILEEVKKTWKIYLHEFLPYLKTFIFILLIFSFARLQQGTEIKETKVKGVDIVLAIDTSGSMLAQDIGKNRIETAKEVIKEFVKKQKNNRLGLVVFSGKSFTLSPLTTDYDFIAEQLDEVNTNIIKVGGTAIGEAITNGTYIFDKNNNKSKVIILLTDGENNVFRISPLRASEIAKTKNIKIYTIGIGKEKGSPIKIKDPQTGLDDYQRDFNGNIIISKINEAELKEIAELTKGEYFNAENKKELDEIYSKINSLEKAEIITKNYKKFSEKFYYFLIPAMVLFLLYFILEKNIINMVRLQ